MPNMDDKYLVVFDSPAGKEVLDHLRVILGVEDTIEPEELINKAKAAEGERDQVPIDVIAMAKRLGQRSVYWKIVAMIRSAKEKRNNES